MLVRFLESSDLVEGFVVSASFGFLDLCCRGGGVELRFGGGSVIGGVVMVFVAEEVPAICIGPLE